MKKILVLLSILITTQLTFAQKQEIAGKIIDANTRVAIQGATIQIGGTQRVEVSDEQGNFVGKDIDAGALVSVRALGYENQQFELSAMTKGQVIMLKPSIMQLKDVVIGGVAGNPYKAISETDIRMRGVSNSQEVLRLIPGLFIGQHQGGGKAEQGISRSRHCTSMLI